MRDSFVAVSGGPSGIRQNHLLLCRCTGTSLSTFKEYAKFLASDSRRFSWDTHSALGFWCFLFILMWGISGLYFSFPQAFYVPAAWIDPAGKYTDPILFVLAEFHFGRFGWYTEALRAVLGLVPGARNVLPNLFSSYVASSSIPATI